MCPSKHLLLAVMIFDFLMNCGHPVIKRSMADELIYAILDAPVSRTAKFNDLLIRFNAERSAVTKSAATLMLKSLIT